MSAQRLIDELVRLGGMARPPATQAMISAAEERLSTPFPPSLADFYRLCDGFEQPTTQWIWDFFSLERLFRLSDERRGHEALRLYEYSERIVSTSLVAFCDVLIDAPTYVFCAEASSPNYGHIFADQSGEGWRVAASFDAFIEVFVAENDECLLNCH